MLIRKFKRDGRSSKRIGTARSSAHERERRYSRHSRRKLTRVLSKSHEQFCALAKVILLIDRSKVHLTMSGLSGLCSRVSIFIRFALVIGAPVPFAPISGIVDEGKLGKDAPVKL